MSVGKQQVVFSHGTSQKIMSREVNIDEAVIHRLPHTNSSFIDDDAPAATTKSSMMVLENGPVPPGPRQPVADIANSRRGRPVAIDASTAQALHGDLASVEKKQQRLRDLREMPPLAASNLYLKWAGSNASGLRNSPSLMEHLAQVMHMRDRDAPDMASARANATAALTTVVERTAGRASKERKIWELLRLVWFHCEGLHEAWRGGGGAASIPTSQHAAAISTMTELMTVSFEADAKQALRGLGTQLCMTSLLRLDHVCYPEQRPRPGSANPAEGHSAFSLRNSVRVNACTILCNLLVNTPLAKTELAQTQGFLAIIKKQLSSPLEELVRVSAVLLQNLSFHVDNKIKSELSDANVIPAVVAAASVAQMKPTVMALTSALWNMSAHGSETYESNNKATLCSAAGGLELVVNLLDVRGDDKATARILENTIGILQNVSSHIVRNTPLLIHVRRLNIYAALSRCLRRRVAGSMLRSLVGALSNFAAGMAEDKEAIRLAGIIPLLEDIAANGAQYNDAKITIYAKQALTNINLAPLPPPQQQAPRRDSAPPLHARSSSFTDRRASPLTTDGGVETAFRPSPTSSQGDVHEPPNTVIDANLVHRAVPGRVHPRRQQRLEQVQQFFNSKENLALASSSGSREGVDNIRGAMSADNVRTATNGDVNGPRKPPRKRSSDTQVTIASQLASSAAASRPSPFFSAQAPDVLAGVGAARSSPVTSWHARSQSDSAAAMAHIPSNRLRAHGHRHSPDRVRSSKGSETDSMAGEQHHHKRQPSNSSTSSGRRQLLSPSPTAPTSSQEIMLSQPIHIAIAEDAGGMSQSQSILGAVGESDVSITHI